MSGPMVRAILDGCKTQTRRVVVPQPRGLDDLAHDFGCDASALATAAWQAGDVQVRCPYGRPGDLLWVRETWCYGASRAGDATYRADCIGPQWADVKGWRPSIHMPRWASRLTLRVTEVRVERVQDISEADAIAEGAGDRSLDAVRDPRVEYAELWNALNAKRGYGWDANPFVWAITFEVVPAPSHGCLTEGM